MAKSHFSILGFVFLLVTTNLFAAAEIKTVHISKLPLWLGEVNGLLWLTSPNASNLRTKIQQIELPTSRKGVIDTPAIISNSLWDRHFQRGLQDLQAFENLRLLDGWKVSVTGVGCLQRHLVVKKDNGFGDTWDVQHQRNDGFFSRRFQCIGSGANVYFAVLLNSRYITFATSEPGFIFFDRVMGKFLPLVIQNNPNHSANIYLTKEGRILVDAYFGEFNSMRSTTLDIKADGIREVTYLGQPLIAPINKNELEQIAKLNKEMMCLIDKFYGRSCSE